MPPSDSRRRVLLDECLPRKLKYEFPEFEVNTVAEMGWAGTKNGRLMDLARDLFDVFVTGDQNLRFQQNLAYSEIGVVVLVAVSNRMEYLLPLMPEANRAVSTIASGEVREIKLGD